MVERKFCWSNKTVSHEIELTKLEASGAVSEHWARCTLHGYLHLVPKHGKSIVMEGNFLCGFTADCCKMEHKTTFKLFSIHHIVIKFSAFSNVINHRYCSRKPLSFSPTLSQFYAHTFDKPSTEDKCFVNFSSMFLGMEIKPFQWIPFVHILPAVLSKLFLLSQPKNSGKLSALNIRHACMLTMRFQGTCK